MGEPPQQDFWSGFLADLGTARFWVGVVLVGIIVGLITNYGPGLIRRLLSNTTKTWRQRQDRAWWTEFSEIKRLGRNSGERANIRLEATYTLLKAIAVVAIGSSVAQALWFLGLTNLLTIGCVVYGVNLVFQATTSRSRVKKAELAIRHVGEAVAQRKLKIKLNENLTVHVTRPYDPDIATTLRLPSDRPN
jgi:hypothetical protein